MDRQGEGFCVLVWVGGWEGQMSPKDGVVFVCVCVSVCA
jgi:hypothetical protein